MVLRTLSFSLKPCIGISLLWQTLTVLSVKQVLRPLSHLSVSSTLNLAPTRTPTWSQALAGSPQSTPTAEAIGNGTRPQGALVDAAAAVAVDGVELSPHLEESPLGDEHEMIQALAAQLRGDEAAGLSTMVVRLETEQKMVRCDGGGVPRA